MTETVKRVRSSQEEFKKGNFQLPGGDGRRNNAPPHSAICNANDGRFLLRVLPLHFVVRAVASFANNWRTAR